MAMEAHHRLLIEHECERLLLRGVWNTDAGQAAQTADLFLADGVMSIGASELRGQEAIRTALLQREAMVQRRSRHIVTNALVTVHDADRAEGRFYVTVYRHDGELATGIAPLDGPQAVGQYDMQFVRTEAGWRFAEWRATTVFERG
jgi:hypothetical protein